MEHKINTAKKVRYVAKNFETGLTDVILKARMPNGDLFEFAPTETELILSEISNGEYEGTYTPDTLGAWQELITSAINGDKAVRSYIVAAIDLATIKAGVDAVDAQLDTIEGKVDTVDTVVDDIATAVATKASQASVDAVKSDTVNIEAKIDALDLQVTPGGYFSN